MTTTAVNMTGGAAAGAAEKPGGNGVDAASLYHANARKVKGCLFRKCKGGLFYVRWMINGVSHCAPTGTADKREARKQQAKILAPYNAKSKAERMSQLAFEADKARAELAAMESRSALAIDAAIEHYLGCSRAGTSGMIPIYRGELEAMGRWMAKQGVKAVRNVSPDLASRFIFEGLATRSAGTKRRYLTLFRHAWDVLRDECGVEANPWRAAIFGEGENKRKLKFTVSGRRALSASELAAVCKPLKGELRTLFAIGIYTGMRLGDAVTLKWSAVRFNAEETGGVIAFTPRKTDDMSEVEIDVPMFPTLAAVLAETPKEDRTGFVVPGLAADYLGDDDRHGDPARVTNLVQAAFAAAKIETTKKLGSVKRARVVVGFHSLRHTFVSMAVNAGVPLETVQAIVGHTTSRMTAHYDHASPEAMARAVETLPVIHTLAALPGGEADELAATAKADGEALADFRRIVARMSPAALTEAARALDDERARRAPANDKD